MDNQNETKFIFELTEHQIALLKGGLELLMLDNAREYYEQMRMLKDRLFSQK